MTGSTPYVEVPSPNAELAASVNEALSPASALAQHGDNNEPGDQDGGTRANEVPGAQQQPVVLTPSRLRIDSRVLVAHTTSVWLMNAIFAILILVKLGGPLQDMSWWSVFVPTWISHAAIYCLQFAILSARVSLFHALLHGGHVLPSCMGRAIVYCLLAWRPCTILQPTPDYHTRYLGSMI